MLSRFFLASTEDSLVYRFQKMNEYFFLEDSRWHDCFCLGVGAHDLGLLGSFDTIVIGPSVRVASPSPSLALWPFLSILLGLQDL